MYGYFVSPPLNPSVLACIIIITMNDSICSIRGLVAHIRLKRKLSRVGDAVAGRWGHTHCKGTASCGGQGPFFGKSALFSRVIFQKNNTKKGGLWYQMKS